MTLVLPVLLAVAIGMVFGGRLSGLTELPLKSLWLIGLAFAAQLVAFPSGLLPWETGDTFATLLWIGSYGLLIAATVRNGHIHGMGLIGLGMSCNLAAIVANGGHMPALPRAAAEAGIVGVRNNSATMAGPHLSLLVDRWAAPDWIPLANVFSIGDVILFLAAFAVVLPAMGPHLPRRDRRAPVAEPSA